ncbi:hypothetical protein ACFSSC_09940 [Corynebacterium mendelii]|uniref:Uncharacterized protein n=1 Tax=Corynebacterium mendelii TaxID=2765362 RepID=A0A939E248_9CORY|nr:hypothetical protein [Corynebacterium mendelii]MBN9644281.1 hypothetical protein [Corynebacterium mendelii]
MENAVGFLRRNLLTPVPVIEDFDEFNRDLLARCDRLTHKSHDAEQERICDLLDVDRAEGLPLPAVPFGCVRHDVRTVTRQGIVTLDGRDCLIGDRCAGQQVILEISTDTVGFSTGTPAQRSSAWPGSGPNSNSRSPAPHTLLDIARTRSRGWKESLVRQVMPDIVVDNPGQPGPRQPQTGPEPAVQSRKTDRFHRIHAGRPSTDRPGGSH